MESSYAEELLDKLSAGVELSRVRDVVGLYSRALAGNDMEIAPAQGARREGHRMGVRQPRHHRGHHPLPAGAHRRRANKVRRTSPSSRSSPRTRSSTRSSAASASATRSLRICFAALRPLVQHSRHHIRDKSHDEQDEAPQEEVAETGPVSAETGWVHRHAGLLRPLPRTPHGPRHLHGCRGQPPRRPRDARSTAALGRPTGACSRNRYPSDPSSRRCRRSKD